MGPAAAAGLGLLDRGLLHGRLLDRGLLDLWLGGRSPLGVRRLGRLDLGLTQGVEPLRQFSEQPGDLVVVGHRALR